MQVKLVMTTTNVRFNTDLKCVSHGAKGGMC